MQTTLANIPINGLRTSLQIFILTSRRGGMHHTSQNNNLQTSMFVTSLVKPLGKWKLPRMLSSFDSFPRGAASTVILLQHLRHMYQCWFRWPILRWFMLYVFLFLLMSFHNITFLKMCDRNSNTKCVSFQ